jgi:hypothetical protein
MHQLIENVLCLGRINNPSGKPFGNSRLKFTVIGFAISSPGDNSVGTDECGAYA